VLSETINSNTATVSAIHVAGTRGLHVPGSCFVTYMWLNYNY